MDFNFKRTWGPSPRLVRVQAYSPKKEFIMIAGPCSVESKEQIEELAKIASDNGATHLRGGVFRAGTYPPNNFGYIDESIIEAYANAAKKNGLKNIIEVLDYTQDSLDMVEAYSDCFQIGSRSMQNYSLLKKLSSYDRQIFLKRNQGATLDEWLGAAEYLLQGKCSPVLIERGSSTFANHVRWDLSISMIAAAKKITKMPVIVDASHGTGRRDLVSDMTLAGIAAGADGCLVEFHKDPNNSLSDSEQALCIEQFISLTNKIDRIREVL